MPDTYAALLRGINVGKAKRISMADLKKMVEGLGCGNVRTLLNSGNVVFTCPKTTSAKVGAKIEKALESDIGVSARVIVISGDELSAIVKDNDLAKVADNPSRLFIGVYANPDDRKKLKALTREEWKTERISIGDRAVYIWCPDGILDSKLAAAVAKALGDAVTNRNWATIQKLHAMTEKK